MTQNTHWNHSGKHQLAQVALAELIPPDGPVENPRSKNRALEKFRRGSNCYYDLYNNGLDNRKQEFRQVFGFSSAAYRCYIWRSNNTYTEEMYARVELCVDKIIEAAAHEQGVAHLLSKEEAKA